MRDLRSLLRRMEDDGYFTDVSRNTAAQFGPPAQPLLGATLLPERLVTENAYREDAIRFRTVIANDGTRYSPVQKKGTELASSMLVELGESDIGREFTGKEYDTLLKLLRGRAGNASMDAMVQLIRWSEISLNRALVMHNERQIWQAIANAMVYRRGDNGYYEEVKYANPPGHRFNANGQWSNNAYDPMDGDILPAVELLAGKGYTVNRIFAGRPVLSLLEGNQKMQARLGGLTLNVGGQLGIATQRADLAGISSIFNRNDLPSPTRYDQQWRSQTGAGHYLARNVLVMTATTGQDTTIDLGDEQRLLPSTLGYNAIGRPVGESDPGRVILLTPFRNKPPRIEGEGWQTQLPVIQDPEAIVVIGGIS